MDYFIASLSYGPKAASGFISPLSAECMLQYKKKAAAYMKALRKVCELLLTFKSEVKPGIIQEMARAFPQFLLFRLYPILRPRWLVGVWVLWGGRGNKRPKPHLTYDTCIGHIGLLSLVPGKLFRVRQPGSQ